MWEEYGISHLHIHELLAKYPGEKIRTREILARKKSGATKHPRKKILDPRNTQEKKFWTHKIPREKILDPQKYQREKMLHP